MKKWLFRITIAFVAILVLCFIAVKDDAQIWAALIGALALYFIFWQTVKKTFEYHKSDKLAEAKLNTYLDLTSKYTEYLCFLMFNFKDIEDIKFKETLNKNLYETIISYNKACLLSNSQTKDQLDIFLHDGLTQLHHSVLTNNVKLEQVFILEESAIKLSLILRNELGVKTINSIEEQILLRTQRRNSIVASSLNEL
ncbi:hypothetical protein [Acinetobacter sp. YH12072]|uniref:hypothetical protein n=1 Tax=Acinetobacter sp. YH12072 TaxID=2601068 RepID=UPI0015D3A4AF|nr:hypothetical protein [Acinetobacter sp. YH12072]